MNTAVEDVLPEDEYPPTPIEELWAAIATLEALFAANKDKGRIPASWLETLRGLKEEAALWYDLDGNPIPVVEEDVPITGNFSPPEIAEVEGYWRFKPANYGDLPRWFREPDRLRHVKMGLEVSLSREHGSFKVRNQEETAKAWIKNDLGIYEGAKLWAGYYSARRGSFGYCSARLLFFAAHLMIDERYMLPTWDRPGAEDLTGYALTPPNAPFNQDEKDHWSRLFQINHLRAAVGGSSIQANMHMNPVTVGGQRVDPNGRTTILTVANHPHWIMPAACGWWNSVDYRRYYYFLAQGMARDMDIGLLPRAEGYRHPSEFGYDEADGSIEAWRRRYESNSVYLPEGIKEFKLD